MRLSEEEIRAAYEKTNTLRALCIELGYKTVRTKESLMPMFEKYNLDPSKYNYHEGRNLTGETYGFLKVLELDQEKTQEYKRRYWKCLCIGCEDNNIISVRQTNLVSGAVRSCGCLLGKSTREDLTGQIFGSLEAVCFDEEKTREGHLNGSHKTYWKCRCLKCSRPDLVSIHTYHLKTHHTTSCGCNGTKSVAEEEIVKILNKNNINFKREFTFPDLKGDSHLLRFDFAILNDKKDLLCLIEYNGIQHYEVREKFGGEEKLKKQQEYDFKKQKYCEERKIPLIILNKNTGYSEQKVLEEIRIYLDKL